MSVNNVAVVLLTYNGKQYLPELFESLAKTQYTKPWELIVVDNASTDGTADFVGKFEIRNSKFEIIRNAENLGFAEGNNVGIRKALADGAEYIILLNQDTVVTPDWLSELVRVAESDETIGAVQARLMLADKKDVVNSLGNETHFLGFGYAGGYSGTYHLKPITYNLREITYASGAAVLYRAKALLTVGLFDESLWMYHDDLDLGWRLWRAGWKNVLAPESVVYHKYEFSRSIKKYYYMERNRFLVLFENYSWRTLALIFPAFIVMELGLFLKAIVSEWGQEKLRAYAYFFRPSTWRLITQKRKEKQKFFRRPEQELLSHFTGVIAFQDIQSPVLQYLVNPLLSIYWRMIRSVIWW